MNAVKWFVVGWFFFWFLKYVVFGLDDWNKVLHPGRIEDYTSWERKFRLPLLGNIGG